MRLRHLLLAVPAALAACAEPTPPGDAGETLRIPVAGGPTDDGWTVWDPADRQNDPRAGEPWYVYLLIGVDAVALPGPVLAVDDATAAELLTGDGESATWTVGDESYAGLTVRVNDRLGYRFDIDDFEDEVSPIRVDLTHEGGAIHSRFVFAADGTDGVAHDAVARAILDGVESDPTDPWTLEAREE